MQTWMFFLTSVIRYGLLEKKKIYDKPWLYGLGLPLLSFATVHTHLGANQILGGAQCPERLTAPTQ